MPPSKYSSEQCFNRAGDPQRFRQRCRSKQLHYGQIWLKIIRKVCYSKASRYVALRSSDLFRCTVLNQVQKDLIYVEFCDSLIFPRFSVIRSFSADFLFFLTSCSAVFDTHLFLEETMQVKAFLKEFLLKLGSFVGTVIQANGWLNFRACFL